MVIPWIGFHSPSLLKAVALLVKQKYICLQKRCQSEQMPGQKNPFFGGNIDYPYIELTIEETMNPLTLMSVGLYGKTLAPQSGAPIRLVVRGNTGLRVLNPLSKLP